MHEHDWKFWKQQFSREYGDRFFSKCECGSEKIGGRDIDTGKWEEKVTDAADG